MVLMSSSAGQRSRRFWGQRDAPCLGRSVSGLGFGVAILDELDYPRRRRELRLGRPQDRIPTGRLPDGEGQTEAPFQPSPFHPLSNLQLDDVVSVDTIRSGTMVYEERTGSGTGSQEVHPGV